MSSENDLGARLTFLEKKVSELSGSNGEILQMLRDVRDFQIRMETKDALSQNMRCPSPGMCLTLKPAIDKLADKVDTHEVLIQQIKGAGMLSRVVWAVVGSGMTALFVHLFLKAH